MQVATLKTFHGERSITVAKVPGTYNVEETPRNQRIRTKKISGWIEALKSGGFNTGDEMLELMLQKRKNPIPKKYIIKAWNSSFRMDAETTLAAIKFANINLTQLERLATFIDIDTRDPGHISKGLRLFALTKECYKIKKEIVTAKYPSMKYKTVSLMIEEVIRRKKKGQKVLRSTDVSVGSIRPMQIIAENITTNRANGTFLPATKRYNDSMYDGETALFKFSADGGAGSIKAVVNPVNVHNPQGQQHVHPFLEFRSKDSYANCKKVLETHPDVKRDMEDVINRRVMLIEVKVGDVVGSCFVINRSRNHDYKTPKKVPELSQAIPLDVSRLSSQQVQSNKRSLHEYAVGVDFDRIARTKLVYNNSTNCYDGILFEDADGNEVGRSYFKTAVSCPQSHHECKMNQILLLGVLASDLQLLCTLFGHQGASATWFCLFCLIKKDQAMSAFAGTLDAVTKRTLDSLIEDAKRYDEAMKKANEKEKQQKGFRSNITQTLSHSVTNSPLINIPLECVTCATMHVVMGLTKWLVDVTIAGYKQIEKKAAATTDGQNQVAFKENIELQLKKAERYKQFLTEQLEDTTTAVEQQHGLSSDIATRVEELEGIEHDIETLFELTEEEVKEKNDRRDELVAELELLRSQGLVQTGIDANTDSIDESERVVDHAQMLLESLCITIDTRDELEHYYNNHVSHSSQSRVVVSHRTNIDEECDAEALPNDSLELGALATNIISTMRSLSIKSYLLMKIHQMMKKSRQKKLQAMIR